MLKNYLKIAWRHLLRDKTTSIINIFGLALSIAVAMLIGLYIRHEWSYDQWTQTEDKIYRLYQSGQQGNVVFTPGELSGVLPDNFPEVKAATHIVGTGESLLSYQGKNIYAKYATTVDSSFFATIPFSFVAGDPKNALEAPNAVVLSEEMALKLFGTENPIGKFIRVDREEERVITGIVAKGSNTHLERDIYIRQNWPNWGWGNGGMATYVRLDARADKENLAKKIRGLVIQYMERAWKEYGATYPEEQAPTWGFQAIEDIHLNSRNQEGAELYIATENMGDSRYVHTISLVALLLLLIAIFNYTNLAIAQASTRAKEIGVRKVTGAKQSQVVRQFLVEAILQSLLAFGIGGGLAYLLLPLFQDLMQVQIALETSQLLLYLPWLILSGLLLGLVAGLYPAFVLARLQPNQVMLSASSTNKKFGLREALVVAQFGMVIMMLSVLTFINQQVTYMLDQDLGFQGEQVITIPFQIESAEQKQKMETAIAAVAGVNSLGFSSHIPSERTFNYQLLVGDQEPASVDLVHADKGIVETWDLSLKVGGNFSKKTENDLPYYLVNEAFVKQFKLNDPLNTPIKVQGNTTTTGQIVGVVKDFHQHSLDQLVKPIVILNGNNHSHISIKMASENIAATIQQLKNIWTNFEPIYPMRYSFLDESFASQYDMQLRLREGLSYATILIILIAILGLFGLASFAIQRRRKEIGIRKVLGASVMQVVGNLNKDFIRLVLIALIIAVPMAWYITNTWLANYPYRIDIHWWVFALTGLLAVGIAFITVSLQSVRAAMTNPVNALKND